MRADRLLTLLLLLQSRGQMTAQQLAKELEVSERTIYRDIDALSSAGVPVYSERGAGGGFGLLDGYRTRLTGLTDKETRAFFMLSIPAPFVDLGVTQELKAALLKMSASLSDAQRHTGEFVRQRFMIDPSGWQRSVELVPHLSAIKEALWQDKKLQVTYRLPFETYVTRVIKPYGLVAKAGGWYVVFGRDDYDWTRTLQVSHIVSACVLDESFDRPTSFELGPYWSEWCAKNEQNRPVYNVTIRAAPELVRDLPRLFGGQVRKIVIEDARCRHADWEVLVLPFESFESARSCILGFGGSADVLDPQELRSSVIDFAAQVLDFYSDEMA
jgi:predicted DNA-binding transcriptional regulator YafY